MAKIMFNNMKEEMNKYLNKDLKRVEGNNKNNSRTKAHQTV